MRHRPATQTARRRGIAAVELAVVSPVLIVLLFGVWEMVRSHIQEGRERFANKFFLAHLEKAAKRFETWIESRSPGHIANMRKMMKEMRQQPAKAA